MNLYSFIKKFGSLRKNSISFTFFFCSLSLISPFTSLAAQLESDLSNHLHKTGFFGINSGKTIFIAASPQLSTILYNQTVKSSTSSQVREYYIKAYNYADAYSTPWYLFNQIVIPTSVEFIGYTPSAGHVYTALLIGGGTANIRERGTSGPFPTLDILGHNTPAHPTTAINMSQVREIKVKY